MSLKQPNRESATSRSPVPCDFPACWGRERDRECLRIETSDGEMFILPYQQFVSARLQRGDTAEVLSISFASHHVSLEGRHLEALVAALQDYAVDWIAPTPLRYQSLRGPNETTITALEIKAVE